MGVTPKDESPVAGERTRAEQLRREIKRHDELYYKHARPLIPDEGYDALCRELAALEERFPELATQDSPTATVGSDSDARFANLPHSRSMISLQNSYELADVAAFIDGVQKELEPADVEFTVEPKIDGVAIALRYEAGRLACALTRGNGREGDVITENMRTLVEIPETLADGWRDAFPDGAPENFEVRGEVYLKLSRLAEINERRRAEGREELANPRNATAGTMKTLDAGQVRRRGLSLFCYSLFPLPDGEAFSTQTGTMAAIAKLGLPVNPFFERASAAAGVEEQLHRLEALRNELDYAIDGAVIKVDSQRWRAALGETAKNPRWGLAYKYAATQAETLLRDVTVQVGRTGVLTPVGELEPVDLAGSRISRVTLHNWEEIERKDLRIGDRVIIAKGGDVIPKVIEAVVGRRRGDETPAERPDACPECGTKVARKDGEVAVRCPNDFCPAVVAGRVRHFVGRDACDIEGLASRGIDQLLDEGLLTDPVDLMRLDRDRLMALEGWGETSANRLIESAKKAKMRPWTNKIFALGIRHVGLRTAEILARNYANLGALREAKADELAGLRDVGPVVGEAIVQYFSAAGAPFVADLESVGFFLEVEDVPPPDLATDSRFAGGNYVLTGTLQTMIRAEARKAIVDRGGSVVSSVSKKNTTAVIAGEKAGSKLAKAEKLGVPVINETTFIAWLDEDRDDG